MHLARALHVWLPPGPGGQSSLETTRSPHRALGAPTAVPLTNHARHAILECEGQSTAGCADSSSPCFIPPSAESSPTSCLLLEVAHFSSAQCCREPMLAPLPALASCLSPFSASVRAKREEIPLHATGCVNRCTTRRKSRPPCLDSRLRDGLLRCPSCGML
jgi:hypothetical protein